MRVISPAARDVALVFQNFSLYPDRTVRQNMAFPLRAPGRGMTREAIDRRVNWAAELLKITHLLDRKSTRLSGGEMQRVAIGRAIVRRPRLFLLDEPLTNLDAKLRESLRVELVMLRRELKTPMIFVTHDQAEALSMGDRIVVLSEGAVLQEGAPEEIYRRPVSPIVARQLGQPGINLVRAMRNEGMWVSVSGLPLTRANGEPFDRALLGIRPEDIDVTGGTHEARIRIIEDMGPVHVLLVDWMGESFHLVSPKRPGLCPGDRIMPKVREGCAIVWNADENPTPDQCGGWNDS